MIILADGTYRVGRTTVAKRLETRFGGNKAERLEVDY